jgi:MFS family permease
LKAINPRRILKPEMRITNLTSRTRGARNGLGFWAVAFAFTTVMAFTTVPTPLWSLYATRDHFSSLTVTLVFAAYAVAVALSLFLAGHLSDSYGRRRVLAPALALNLIAGVVFVGWPDLPGLLVARVLSGFGIGAVTATATAWLTELHAAHRPNERGGRSQAMAIAANLGGLGLGGLISGLLAQWAGSPLRLPFVVLLGALLLAEIGLLIAPETRGALQPHPRYRPQRVSVPPRARGRFVAAALGAMIAFALFGLVTSLAPSFLEGTLHEPSHALAGAVSFAMFASAALAQMLSPSRTPQQLLAAAVPVLLAGVALLTLALWLPTPSLAVFLAGDVLAGVGAGLMFKGAIGTVSEIALPDHRAETLAGLFLAAYLGLAGPVIGLGALTQIASTRVSLLVFSGLLTVAIFAAAAPLLVRRGRGPRPSTQPQPTS